jgi:hypothetical protein
MAVLSDSLEALFKAIRRQLKGANALWGDRVRPEYIPGRDIQPTIVYSWAGGGEILTTRRREANYTIDIKIITSNEHDNQNANVDAMAGARFISKLINNQGSQDQDSDGNTGLGEITGDDEWVITTITQGMRIHVVDNWSTNGVAVYHSGHEFTVTMEEV